MQILNARLGKALAIYASASFAVLQAVDMFQDRLALPVVAFVLIFSSTAFLTRVRSVRMRLPTTNGISISACGRTRMA